MKIQIESIRSTILYEKLIMNVNTLKINLIQTKKPVAKYPYNAIYAWIYV